MLCELYLNKGFLGCFILSQQDSVTEWNCKIKQRDEQKITIRIETLQLNSCSVIYYVYDIEQVT